MTVIGGTIADIWDVPDRGLPMALFSGTVFIGRECSCASQVYKVLRQTEYTIAPSPAVIGPVIAGYLSSVGWRWNYVSSFRLLFHIVSKVS